MSNGKFRLPINLAALSDDEAAALCEAITVDLARRETRARAGGGAASLPRVRRVGGMEVRRKRKPIEPIPDAGDRLGGGGLETRRKRRDLPSRNQFSRPRQLKGDEEFGGNQPQED